MYRRHLIALAVGALAFPGGSLGYYVAWEGDCLPEEAGWSRDWGDWSGQYHGTGAVRTLADGVMTMDSLYDPGVYDLAYLHRSFNPPPGELFVMEWRLAVDQVVGGYSGDPGIFLYSDDRWGVALYWRTDSLSSPFDPALHVSVTAGEFHDYRLASWDMRTYDLVIDGELAYQGWFWYQLFSSEVEWGDGTQGVASLHRWDYVRIYTIPEPTCLALSVVPLASLMRGRRSGEARKGESKC